VAGSLTHAAGLMRILPKRRGLRDDIIFHAHAVCSIAANQQRKR